MGGLEVCRAGGRAKLAALAALLLAGCWAGHGRPAGAGAGAGAGQLRLPPEAVSGMRARFEAARGARYMEKVCASAAYSGWAGLPTVRCRYAERNRDGTLAVAEVVLLDASPAQLARWVVATCVLVKGGAAPECTDAIFQRIIGQSGAQYPVAGVVLEDILPADGVMEAYCFRDGVTVRVEGFVHRDTLPLSPAAIERCITGPVVEVFRYARIQSTTREDYRANGGTVDVGTSEDRKATWLDVSRSAYQAAWGHDRNELMIAWARAHL